MTTFPSDCQNTSALTSTSMYFDVYLAANTKYCYSGYSFMLKGARNVNISYLNDSNWVEDVKDAIGASGFTEEDDPCELVDTVFRITTSESQIVTFIKLDDSVSCDSPFEVESFFGTSFNYKSILRVYFAFADHFSHKLTGKLHIVVPPLNVSNYASQITFFNPNPMRISSNNVKSQIYFYHTCDDDIDELTERKTNLTAGTGFIVMDQNYTQEEISNAFENGGDYYYSSTITAEKTSGDQQFTEKLIELKAQTIYTNSMPNSRIAVFSPLADAGFAAWKIAVIVVAGVVGVGLIGFCIYFFTCRHKSVEAQEP